jgi:hypothetical protein
MGLFDKQTKELDAAVVALKTEIIGLKQERKETVAKEETPEAWLRRRVEEICWRPA